MCSAVGLCVVRRRVPAYLNSECTPGTRTALGEFGNRFCPVRRNTVHKPISRSPEKFLGIEKKQKGSACFSKSDGRVFLEYSPQFQKVVIGLPGAFSLRRISERRRQTHDPVLVLTFRHLILTITCRDGFTSRTHPLAYIVRGRDGYADRSGDFAQRHFRMRRDQRTGLLALSRDIEWSHPAVIADADVRLCTFLT